MWRQEKYKRYKIYSTNWKAVHLNNKDGIRIVMHTVGILWVLLKLYM